MAFSGQHYHGEAHPEIWTSPDPYGRTPVRNYRTDIHRSNSAMGYPQAMNHGYHNPGPAASNRRHTGYEAAASQVYRRGYGRDHLMRQSSDIGGAVNPAYEYGGHGDDFAMQSPRISYPGEHSANRRGPQHVVSNHGDIGHVMRQSSDIGGAVNPAYDYGGHDDNFAIQSHRISYPEEQSAYQNGPQHVSNHGDIVPGPPRSGGESIQNSRRSNSDHEDSGMLKNPGTNNAALVGKMLKEAEYKAMLSQEENVNIAAEKLGLHTIREMRKLRQLKEILDIQKLEIPKQDGDMQRVFNNAQLGTPMGQPPISMDTEGSFQTGPRTSQARQLSALWRIDRLRKNSSLRPLSSVGRIGQTDKMSSESVNKTNETSEENVRSDEKSHSSREEDRDSSESIPGIPQDIELGVRDVNSEAMDNVPVDDDNAFRQRLARRRAVKSIGPGTGHAGHVNISFQSDEDVPEVKVEGHRPLLSSVSCDNNNTGAQGQTNFQHTVDDLVLGMRLRRQLKVVNFKALQEKERTATEKDASLEDSPEGTRRVSVASAFPPLEGALSAASTLAHGSTLRKYTTERLFIRELQEHESQLLSAGRPPLKGASKWKYERSREWKRRKRSIREFFANFNMWQGSFKTIEGNFGSSVVSYFQFLKWLFLLNVFTCLCILGTVVLPQALMAPRDFNATLYTGNKQGLLTGYQEISSECSQNYTQTVLQNTDSGVGSNIIDFFQGTGYMENTYLFIGFYFNKTQLYLESSPVYNMPVAYLLSTAGYLLVTLVLMVRYTADGVKEKLISKGDKFYKASSMVFCGWDYTLSQEKAATYKHQNLHQEFVRELKKQKRDSVWKNMPPSTKCRIYTVRVLINILTLVILTACAALIYFSVEVWKPQLLEMERVKDSNILTLLVEFLPSFTLTALNLVFPFLFQKVVLAERYTPGAELKITIVRTVFLRLASLVVLAVTLLRLISCSDDEKHCGNCNRINCWETYVGQELYKLVILDFFVVLATTFVVEFPRNAIIKAVPKLNFFRQEFDLPVNVLNIVYAQTLSWWGGFYSPLIPAVTVVKLFVFFYCKKVSLLVNQLPPSRPYRASKSNHFFMIILLISFTLSGLAIAYSVGKIPPSQGCSPFRIYSEPDYKMFHSVTNAVSTFPLIVRELFYFIASWVFYMILMVIIILCIYYYTAKTSGSKKVVDLLKEQLALVETDKQFLLKRVNEALHQGGFSQ